MTPPKKVRPACSSTRGVMPPDTTLIPDDGWLEWLVPMRAIDPPASDGLAAPGPPAPALLLSPPQEEYEVEYTPLELTPDLPPPHSPPNLGCSAHRVSGYNETASMGGHDVVSGARGVVVRGKGKGKGTAARPGQMVLGVARPGPPWSRTRVAPAVL